MYFKAKSKGDRKAVNIRVPIEIAILIEEQAQKLSLTNNDMYVVALYDYFRKKV